MKKTFKFSVIINGGDETPVFMDNEYPGVVETVEVTYDLTEEQYRSPIFANSLANKQREIMEGAVSVAIEEIR